MVEAGHQAYVVCPLVEESEKLVRQFRARYLLSEDFVIGIFSVDGRQLLGGTGFLQRKVQAQAAAGLASWRSQH